MYEPDPEVIQWVKSILDEETSLFPIKRTKQCTTPALGELLALFSLSTIVFLLASTDEELATDSWYEHFPCPIPALERLQFMDAISTHATRCHSCAEVQIKVQKLEQEERRLFLLGSTDKMGH